MDDKTLKCAYENLLGWLEVQANKIADQRENFESDDTHDAWWLYTGKMEGLEMVADHLMELKDRLKVEGD